jgi:sporulation and spore germination protein
MKARRLVLVAAVLALVSGCGIRGEARPRDITDDQKLFPLASDATSTPGTTAKPGSPKVFLLGSDNAHVVGANRDATTLDDRLRALLRGPTPQEFAKGFTSAIPINTSLVSTQIDATTRALTIALELDPNSTLAGVSGPKAFAQLVYTATAEQDQVSGVLFVVNGQAIKGVSGAGLPVEGALTRADFAGLAPVTPSDFKPPGATIATTTLPPATVAVTPPATG